MHCYACGHKNLPDSRFCAQCGTALSEAIAQTVAAPETLPGPRVAAVAPTKGHCADHEGYPIGPDGQAADQGIPVVAYSTPDTAALSALPEPSPSLAAESVTTAVPAGMAAHAESTTVPLPAVAAAPVAPIPAAPVTTPAVTSAVGRTIWPTRLLAALAVVLALTLTTGTLLARELIDRRDAVIAELTSQVERLTAANAAFQAENQGLAAERQELLATRERLAGERNDLVAQRDGLRVLRDQLIAQRDGLQVERDRLATQVADLEKRTKELGEVITERDRQLGQARQEGARQQHRAESAESLSALLAQVVAIDEQIQREFITFFTSYDDYNRAVQRGSYASAQQAYSRSLASADRLRGLFAQRDALLRQSRS
jgi:hypothetical protein